MKYSKNLLLVIVLLSIFSCHEKERAFPEFDDLEKGSFPRLINPVQGVFDYDNPDISFLEFEVEFYDEANGGMVESYSWDISYGDLDPITISTKNKSDFVVNEDGLPSISFKFTFTEIFDVLNLTIDDILPDKEFFLSATLKRTDGKIFTFENTGNNIIGQPTFQGFFQYKPEMINMPCYSLLEGSFDTYTKADFPINIGGGCEETWEGIVRWEAKHAPSDFIGIYKIYSTYEVIQEELEDPTMGAYYACYNVANFPILPDGTLRIKHECNILSFIGLSQWGEIYSFTKVEANGATLNLRWENDYGEAAFVDLTRTDGKAWPEDLTCDGC